MVWGWFDGRFRVGLVGVLGLVSARFTVGVIWVGGWFKFRVLRWRICSFIKYQG